MQVRRLSEVIRQEINGVQIPLQITLKLTRTMPDLFANRIRTSLLRLAGIKIGSGTVIGGGFWLQGFGRVQDRLSVGSRCFLNAGCRFDASSTITIGDDVALGHEVLVLTQSHVVGPATRRADALIEQPVVIGAGSWIGARAIIMPGVTVGNGAIVAAGALVRTDVPANTVVAGVPARVVRTLSAAAD